MARLTEKKTAAEMLDIPAGLLNFMAWLKARLTEMKTVAEKVEIPTGALAGTIRTKPKLPKNHLPAEVKTIQQVVQETMRRRQA